MKRLKGITATYVSLLFLVSLSCVPSISINQGKDDKSDKGAAEAVLVDGIAAATDGDGCGGHGTTVTHR